MKKLLFFVASLVAFSLVNAQTPVTVCDQSLKIGAMGEETFYYGFAEGDQIVFDFEEVNGKELKEIEIVELPSSSKYSAFKTAKVTDKKIYVNQKGVYSFRFKNGAAAGRICNVKIQRIPESPATQKFNTGWKWKTMYDTTYVPYTQDSLVGYDTLRYKEIVVEEYASHFEEIDLLPGGKPVTVHSSGIIVQDNPREAVMVRLPNNEKTKYQSKTVKGWAYWIGVGSTAESVFSKNKENIKTAATSIVGIANPLAGLAIGMVTDLVIPTASNIDPVRYYITDANNKNLFMGGNAFRYFDNGFGKGGVGKFSDKNLQGTYFICLYNENLHDRIDVTVKANAVVEIKDYQDVEYDRVKVTPRYVTLHKKRMVVNTSQVRVNAE